MATPLTKRDQQGALYERPNVIEDAIDTLMKESLEILTSRANIPETSSPQYVPSECIVHFIRRARHRSDEQMLTALLPVLLRRSESILLSKISNDLPRAEEIREEILGRLGELFAADGAGDNPYELDFFEVRFNQAFRTFRIDIFREEQRRESVRGQGSIPTPFEDDGDTPSDDEVFVRLSKAFHAPATQESEFILRQIKQAIDALPPDERKAVVLCCVLGYEQESDDPKKRTAAKICGVTGKTIRNRLRRAATRLSQFKELIQ